MQHGLCFMVYLLFLCDCRGTEVDKMLANFILVSIVIVIPFAFSPTDLNNVFTILFKSIGMVYKFNYFIQYHPSHHHHHQRCHNMHCHYHSCYHYHQNYHHN